MCCNTCSQEVPPEWTAFCYAPKAVAPSTHLSPCSFYTTLFTLLCSNICLQEVPAEWTAFCYVHGGAGSISGQAVRREQAVVLGPGDHFTAEGG